MKLEEAEEWARKICVVIEPYCDGVAAVGSIRRRRPEVNDVDLVAIPNDELSWNLIPKALSAHFKAAIERQGPELIMVRIPTGERALEWPFNLSQGLSVDVYRARKETWGLLMLIRTGSKEHNIKMCSMAKDMGYMLSAKRGVLDHGRVITSGPTEQDIFKALGSPYVKPEDREVKEK